MKNDEAARLRRLHPDSSRRLDSSNPAGRKRTPRVTGLSAATATVVRGAEGFREIAGAEEYRAFVAIVAGWFAAELARLEASRTRSDRWAA